jgi:hypothetical protein
MSRILSTKELAAEALRALEENRMTPREHFEFLVREGIIDREGRVLVCRYFSGGAPPDGDTPPATPPDPPAASQGEASGPG